MKPLVSVICLCYNHGRFVEEAITSVLNQTYDEIEIILIDDFSTDHSREVISKILEKNHGIKFIQNESNLGNCRSFNKAFKIAKGKYIIDFATDDVMFPERIQKQVGAFEKLDLSFGVLFTDAVNINKDGKVIDRHYKEGTLVPSGDVYKNVLATYFINPPTMMIRRTVLETLGGYDETLQYEDFDFWVRSSREYKYYYLPEVLTKRRRTSGSLSSKFYKKEFDNLSASTYRVIQKALWLNRSSEENKALAKRIKYEMRLAFYMQNFKLVANYEDMLIKMNEGNLISGIISFLATLRLPVFYIYKLYLRFK